MDYMKIVCFMSSDPQKVVAQFRCDIHQETSLLDMPLLVPCYLLLETVFQTSGKAAREHLGSQYGGYIVQLQNFCLSRPVFCGETLTIESTVMNFHKTNQCSLVRVEIYSGTECIEKEGLVIVKNDSSLEEGFLNNSEKIDMEGYLHQYGYR
jgi:hypothetical protein